MCLEYDAEDVWRMSAIKNPYFLRREDNTPEAWEANANFHLTDAQVERLKHVPSPEWRKTAQTYFEQERQERAKPLARAYWRSVRWAFVSYLVMFLAMRFDIQFLAVLAAIIAFGFLTPGLINRAKAQTMGYEQASEADLLEIALKLSNGEPLSTPQESFTFNPRIVRHEGKLTNGWLGLRIGDMNLTNRIENNYVDELMRPIFGDDKSGRHDIIKRQRHYEAMCYMNLVTPPIVLSLRHLDAVLPPGEAKLKRVVGVGDDGELVYADELEGEQETTEIIVIERRDRADSADG
jgi:hypothetical protein